MQEENGYYKGYTETEETLDYLKYTIRTSAIFAQV